VYGLRAAAHHYFNRGPENLTLAQSAMLAGIVQAPSRLAPTRNLRLAQQRSRLVLKAMADTGAVSQTRASAVRLAKPILQRSKIPTGTYFADWVAPAAQHAFDADFGEVKVRTTLDADLQRLAVRAIRRRWSRCGQTAVSSPWSVEEAISKVRSTVPLKRAGSPDRPSSYSSILPRFAPVGPRTA
jgi:membrane peptidoglycan carboxypeptidase